MSSCSVDKNLWSQKEDPPWPDVPLMKSLISGSDQIGNRCLANRKDEQGGISILLHNAGAVARKKEVVELPIFRQLHRSIKEDEEVEQRGGVWSDGDDGIHGFWQRLDQNQGI